jgi:rod shape-determining protein MreD
VKAAWTAAVILLALLLQSTLSQLAPAQARLLDPFLLVVVYCGLHGGETHGMLAGMAAGWVQDVHFGGTVVGLSGLTKLIVGFGVGIAGARFLVGSLPQRLLVLFVAALLDSLIHERLALLFDVALTELSFGGLLGRAAVNAVLGGAFIELIDRRLRGGRPS